MTSKWNQLKQSKMTEHKPDEEKLISIATLMRKRLNLIVKREPFLLFDKETCKLVKVADYITREEHAHYIPHNPDLLFYIKEVMWIMEIDGWIHEVKNRVIEKDKMRNEQYQLSGINHIIINEQLILHNLGIDKHRPATVAELWPVIDRRIKKLLN